MSDNTINQVYNLDSSSVDELNRKLAISNQLKQQLSSDAGDINAGYTKTSSGGYRDPSTGRFASASTVAAASASQHAGIISAGSTAFKDAAEKGFISNSLIGYTTDLLGGVEGENGLPIGQAEWSVRNFGQAQQAKANRAGINLIKQDYSIRDMQESGVSISDDASDSDIIKGRRVMSLMKEANRLQDRDLKDTLSLSQSSYIQDSKLATMTGKMNFAEELAAAKAQFPYAGMNNRQMKALTQSALQDAGVGLDPPPEFINGYGGRFTRGGLYAVGSSAAEYANAMQNEAMTGRPDYRAQGNAAGSLIGGLTGAAVGSLFPGYGTFIGAGVGMQLGGTVGSFMEVGHQKEMLNAIASQPIASLSANYYAGRSGDWAQRENVTSRVYNPGGFGFGVPSGPEYRSENLPSTYAGSVRIADRAMGMRKAIGLQVAGQGYDSAVSTVEGMTSNYEAAYLGILDAGENPDSDMIGTQGVQSRQIGSHKRKKVDAYGNPVGKWVDVPFNDQTFNSGTDITDSIGQSTEFLRGASDRASGVVTDTNAEGGLNGFSGGLNLSVRQNPSSINGAVSAYGDRNTGRGEKYRGISKTSTYSSGSIKGTRSKFIQEEEDVPDFAIDPTGSPEKKYTWYAENAQRLFLSGSDEIMKKVFTPIYSAKNKTGDNMVDIIQQFGGRAAAQYEQILTPYGQKPPLTVEDATKFAAGLQANDRSVQIAQLSVRDSGSQWLGAMESRMASMVDPLTGKEMISGAASSIEYAKSRQGAISAQGKTWQDYDSINYNMGAMRLQNQERRYEVNPYSPGNRMALELQGLGQDRARIGTLREREGYMRSRGMLSEEQEFQFESQIEGLETNRQERIGHLVDGVANRLPSMSAGRPSFGNRIDSRQMTAMQFGMISFPYRGAGAMNDQQRQSQEHFLEQFLDPSEINSRSRTFTLNNHGPQSSGRATGTTSSLGAPGAGMNGGNISSSTTTQISAPTMETILQQILQAVINGGLNGKSGHPGETNGIQNFLNRTASRP